MAIVLQRVFIKTMVMVNCSQRWKKIKLLPILGASKFHINLALSYSIYTLFTCSARV